MAGQTCLQSSTDWAPSRVGKTLRPPPRLRLRCTRRPATLSCSKSQHQPASCSSSCSFRRRHPSPHVVALPNSGVLVPLAVTPDRILHSSCPRARYRTCQVHVNNLPVKALRPCSYFATGIPKPRPALPSTDPFLVSRENNSFPPTE